MLYLRVLDSSFEKLLSCSKSAPLNVSNCNGYNNKKIYKFGSKKAWLGSNLKSTGNVSHKIMILHRIVRKSDLPGMWLTPRSEQYRKHPSYCQTKVASRRFWLDNSRRFCCLFRESHDHTVIETYWCSGENYPFHGQENQRSC